MKFCGLELQRTAKGGLAIHQMACLQATLKSHKLDEVRTTNIILDKAECATSTSTSTATLDQEEKQEKGDAGLVKVAQGLAGEVNWIAQKSRPDITYSIHRASSLAQGEPERSAAISTRIMRFLSSTKDHALVFPSQEEIEDMISKEKLATQFADNIIFEVKMSASNSSLPPSQDIWENYLDIDLRAFDKSPERIDVLGRLFT